MQNHTVSLQVKLHQAYRIHAGSAYRFCQMCPTASATQASLLATHTLGNRLTQGCGVGAIRRLQPLCGAGHELKTLEGQEVVVQEALAQVARARAQCCQRRVRLLPRLHQRPQYLGPLMLVRGLVREVTPLPQVAQSALRPPAAQRRVRSDRGQGRERMQDRASDC